MTACDSCREQIDLRMDGMLDDSMQAQLEDHLAQCAACRRYDAAQKVLSDDLSTLSRVADLLTSPTIQRSRRTPNWMHAGKVAAALAFAVLCTWTFVRRPSPRPPSRPDPVAVNLHEDKTDAPSPVRFSVSIAPADDQKRFAIPMKTDNPRIHMVWLYDAVSPQADAVPASAPSS